MRIPLPKRPVLAVIETRDKRNILHPILPEKIDPADYHIVRESPAAGDLIYEAKITAIRKQYAGLNDKVGVFEGAGYSAKGLYRPQVYCIMISSPTGEFCAVCRRAIARMIEFYGGGI